MEIDRIKKELNDLREKNFKRNPNPNKFNAMKKDIPSFYGGETVKQNEVVNGPNFLPERRRECIWFIV